MDLLVVKEYGQRLHSREAAKHLFTLIKDDQSEVIIVDFKDIDSISRSFADQFYKEKQKIQKNHSINLNILNCSEQVAEMFSIVEKTQNKEDRFFKRINPFILKDKEDLSEFLLSI